MRANGAPEPKPRGTPEAGDNDKPVFQEYFSVESLFSPLEADEETVRVRPWRILGVPEDAGWSGIQGAHRRLAKQLHPDRWVNASEAQLLWAEEAIRRVNEAMADLRVLYFGTQTSRNPPQ